MKSYANISWDDIASMPPAGMQVPVEMKFSPDNAHLTYLLSPPGSSRLELWAVNLSTREAEKLAGAPEQGGRRTLEDELRRERQRMPWEGITGYQFASGTPRYVLIPHASALSVLNLTTREYDVIDSLAGVEDPYLTPDAQQIVYVRDQSLFTFDRRTRKERCLFSADHPQKSVGLAEYVAQEEFDRAHGFFVSPDMRWIAFEEVNTQEIPRYVITDLTSDSLVGERHPYPFVGKSNASTRLGIMPLSGGEVDWIHWDEFGECYITDVRWSPSSHDIIVQVLTRDQKNLIVLRYNPAEKQRTILWIETAPEWVNVTHDLFFLPSGDILTTSEGNRDGFRHLVIRDAQGSTVKWVTEGQWMVTGVLGVSPDGGQAVIQATKESAVERHIYQVDLISSDITRLTTLPGTHRAVLSSDFRWMVDQYSSLSMSPRTVLIELKNKDTEDILLGPEAVNAEALGLKKPDIVSVDLANGTRLYGAVYTPYAPDPSLASKHPVIVAVYGGPHAQLVINGWNLTADLSAQYFAQHGYLVLKVDNRGSANRGKDFERVLYRRFGTVELEDQLAALEWVHQHYATDPERVGIYGWSYGGFMTLSALLKAPDVFKVGVAGAPVTDFRYYDTAYTERYMGTDETNHAGYEQASVNNFASQLRGKLLVIHGLLDENVHFRHTALLADALIAQHKDFSLLALPKTRHMPRGFDVLYMIARKRSEFFQNYL
ncbi:MAG: S9 family peptidase [Sulfobacillus benefaciens]|uniref:S9 family peptidase n=1 Tax=Sulfobacillus benefaciens TaxID=453960 RepID=A0A2T2X9A8_9FIRM|nr:MAG: S9 family peptidase [Sulfobacillus benefaciens]